MLCIFVIILYNINISSMKSFLNESQIERIADAVNKSSIAPAEMKDDLIDHLCCIAEEEMSKGKDFETVYQTVLSKRFGEIRNETMFLSTSKSRKRLERTLYVSGFIALTGVLATVVMKSLHVPGGGIVLLATVLVVLFVFFPAVFVRLFRDASGKKPIYYYFGFVGAILLVLAIFFNIMHWPGPALFLPLAVVFVYIALFPLFFVKILKKSR